MTADDTDQERLKAAEAARCKALIAADREGLAALLADDYVYIHASGRVEGKDAYVKALGSEKMRYLSFDKSDVTLKLHGDTAIMSGRNVVVRQLASGTETNHMRFVSVWTRSPAWRLAYSQNTKIRDQGA